MTANTESKPTGLRDLRRNADHRETAHVFARETIRMGILNGILPAGMRLFQGDLAEELQVSTTPVREALRDLSSEGLVLIDPHRGGVVREIDHDDLEEIQMLLESLEPMAIVEAIPNITPDIVTKARELHAEMCASSNSAVWVELNREFHLMLFAASNRPRLLEMIQKLKDASTMAISNSISVNPELRKEANIEHGELIDALEAGDTKAAKKIMLGHTNLSMRALDRSEFTVRSPVAD